MNKNQNISQYLNFTQLGKKCLRKVFFFFINISRYFPRRVAVMVTPLVVNDLCSSWDESLQHHNVHPVPTFTHLEKDVLKAALNAHQESYDHEGMEGVSGVL